MPDHQVPAHDKKSTNTSATTTKITGLSPAQASSLDAGQAIQRVRNTRYAARPSDLLTLQRTAGNRAVQRLLAERDSATTPATRVQRQIDPSNNVSTLATPVVSQQSRSTLMRAVADEPYRNIKQSALKNHIQRAENWDDFKGHTKGIWGKGGKFRSENQRALNFFDPRQAYHKHADKGGKWNKFKGIMSGAGHALASPFMALHGLGSLGARGLETLGAGAYYGAKAAGGGIVSGARAMGRGIERAGTGIKNFVNKDRNPHGYDRSRVPTTATKNLEWGKPAAALGVSGGVLGGAESASMAAGFPAGSGTLNLITAADAALTWYNGAKMRDQAKQRGDLAGEKVGTRKANQGKWGLMGGVVGTAQGALNLGTAIDVGSKGLMSMHDLFSKASYASSGLGIAGAGVGIAGSAIAGAQGLWKSGKAISKLRALGKSEPMLTEEGEQWKARAKNREKTKLGLNVLKTIAAGVGIAAGALVIASNPVGWALGVASAVVLGGLAAKKLYTKYKKAKRKQKAKQSVREEMEQQQSEPPSMDVESENPGGEEGQDEARMGEADPSKLDPAKRKQAVELGNRIAQKVSKSGKVAGEIRAALAARTHPMYAMLDDSLHQRLFTHQFLRQNNVKDYPFPKQVLRARDAMVMVKVLNLTPEQVESESGQELIEKKLSATDSL